MSLKRNKKYLIIFLICINYFYTNAQEVKWQKLAEKDLSDFTILNGSAEFRFQEGMIIGITELNTPNTFLASKKKFKNFELEFDVKLDEGLNSGVQFRSNSDSSYMDGQVYGYQFELEDSPRNWAGGIYEEAGRGWLYPITWNQDSVFTKNDWNHCRLLVDGHSIKTFINGKMRSNLIDSLTDEGFIAFQIHSIHKEELVNKKIFWKNIMIREIDNQIENEIADAPIISYIDLPSKQQNEIWNCEPANNEETEHKVITTMTRQSCTLQASFESDLQFDFRLEDQSALYIHYKIGSSLVSLPLTDDRLIVSSDSLSWKTGGLIGVGAPKNLSERNRNSTRFNPPHYWNRIYIKRQNGEIEHWLNNILVLKSNVDELENSHSLNISREQAKSDSFKFELVNGQVDIKNIILK